MPPGPQYELIADHHSQHGPTVVQVRGSLLASSLATLRMNNLFDRYLEHLPAEQHDNVLYVARRELGAHRGGHGALRRV